MIDPKSTIKSFIVKNFLFGNSGQLTDDTSFLEEGIIDSTGAMELTAFLENEFRIKIGNEELTIDNLDTINKIVNFLSKKNNTAATDPKTSASSAPLR
jgi:acyl carrier protein